MERSSETEQGPQVAEAGPALAPSGPAVLPGGFGRGGPLTRAGVLGLQGTAGNAAVARMIQERRLAREAVAEPETEAEQEEAEEAPAQEFPPSEEPEDPGGGDAEPEPEAEGEKEADAEGPAGASLDGEPPQPAEPEPMTSGTEEPAASAAEASTADSVEAPEQEEEVEGEDEAEPAEALGDESEMEPDAAEERTPAAGVARLMRKVEAQAAAKRDDTVGPGDTGKAVRGIQRRLRSLGWYRGSLDGEYGPATQSAVRRFQARRRLEADGVAGSSTRRALARAIEIQKEITRLQGLIGDRPGGGQQHLLKQIEELKGKLRAYKPASGGGKRKPRKPRPDKPQKDRSGAAPGGPADGPGGNRQTGIIGDAGGEKVRLREGPSTNSRELGTLPFGTRLFIKRRTGDGWYQVTTASGEYGYVAAVYVKRNLPEPTADLFKIEGQTALEIVTKRYGHLGRDGQDMRFYVNVLEYVNRGPGMRGIYQSKPGNKDWNAWQDVKTRSGYQIWLPGDEYAKSLKGTVGSGSLTGGAFAKAKRAANAVEEFAIGGAAFVAGMLSGAFSSVKGILVDAKDLIGSLWNVMTSSVKELVSQGQDLWNRITKIKPGEIASSAFKRFSERWNHPDMWTRWKFRGFIAGFALVEVALLALTAGIGAAVKLAKLGRMLKGFAKELPGEVEDRFIRRFKQTGPSGKPDPNAKPGGHPAKIPEGQKQSAAIRGLELENDAAEALAKAGYDIVQRPNHGKPTKPGERDPDFKIEGRIFDCYSPGKEKPVRGIWTEVHDKVLKKKQTERVVINLADWAGDMTELQSQFTKWPIKQLHEVLIVDNTGAVSRLNL
ncbi:peptidoglycan-binding protein [Solirubrobacter taibaiensis]|nr:peptidoglycan-binding protein [Solirubrobacter taibaiensis]